jgi:hypothetical protein
VPFLPGHWCAEKQVAQSFFEHCVHAFSDDE